MGNTRENTPGMYVPYKTQPCNFERKCKKRLGLNGYARTVLTILNRYTERLRGGVGWDRSVEEVLEFVSFCA